MTPPPSQNKLFNQVVRVTHVYLGPAAERFIGRQIENHLQKPPEDLTKADLAKLIDWIRVAVSLLTEDPEIIEEYINQLQRLISADSSAQGTDKHGAR